MTSYYGEVGLFSRAGSQEQAPPCISIISHPCSSQGPETKSKESLLSRTKLFNIVICHIFFIPSLFAIGNEAWWKIWCIVLHTNKELRISLSFMVMKDRIGSATMRNAFSDSWVLQGKQDNHFIHSIWKGKGENANNWLCWAGLPFYLGCLILAIYSPRVQAFRAENMILGLTSPVKQKESNIFSQHAASATSYVASIWKHLVDFH